MDAALQVPLSMGFSRQEYWSGLPCPSPGDLPHPEIKRMFVSYTGNGFFTIALTGKPICQMDKNFFFFNLVLACNDQI